MNSNPAGPKAKRYLFRGEHLTVKEISNLTGWRQAKVRYRISGHEVLETLPDYRSTFMLTYNGKTQSIKAWAKEVGISYDTLRERLVTFHWPVARALTEPVMNTAERHINRVNKRAITNINNAFRLPRMIEAFKAGGGSELSPQP